MESVRFEEIERPNWSSGRCPGGQAEMSKDFGDHRGIFKMKPHWGNVQFFRNSYQLQVTTLTILRTYSGLKVCFELLNFVNSSIRYSDPDVCR
jgi:hypothetical protein